MLLHRYKPDLEILNNVVLGDTNTTRQIFSNVSLLWVATSINDFEVVKLLVEHGANVNHRTKTNSTPLRGASYNGNVDMARYLIENGADVHLAKENNDTNLMVSVCHKHLNMVTYLVDELNYDVNECDNNGRSSLYDAVTCGSVELVEFLLKRGARNFQAVVDQMSPLMWAAERKRSDLVDTLSPYCSLLERIEAEELLASALICGSRDDHVLDQSFKHFCRALELRTIHNLSKATKSTTNAIFDNRHECQTIKQLEEIRSNTDQLYIEALLVRERLLGSTNGEYRYSLCYRGAILADNGQYHKAVAYWIYELSLCQQYSISIDPKHLRRFASLFSGIYPCLITTRILLQCGAAVNAYDTIRNTPLHIIASSKSAYNKCVLNLLCDAGAHLDCVNAFGQTPIDLATISDIKQLLKSRMKISLKCLCAQLIRKKNVPFHDKIAVSLINFVEKH
ncbi:unnamed protein product [Rotaria sordida]|uniref:Protein fem-1 homolog B n=1 Tax=Rotaria sordida TaxID=392033 RepID=A0A818ZIM7_9BILA|nr:unnamed protein product [Rotaria sordida]